MTYAGYWLVRHGTPDAAEAERQLFGVDRPEPAPSAVAYRGSDPEAFRLLTDAVPLPARIGALNLLGGSEPEGDFRGLVLEDGYFFVEGGYVGPDGKRVQFSQLVVPAAPRPLIVPVSRWEGVRLSHLEGHEVIIMDAAGTDPRFIHDPRSIRWVACGIVTEIVGQGFPSIDELLEVAEALGPKCRP